MGLELEKSVSHGLNLIRGLQLNIRRYVVAVLLLLVLLSIVGIKGATAQGGPTPPVTKPFTLTLADYTNNTLPYEDYKKVISINLEIMNNENEPKNAVVSMVHDLYGNLTEQFLTPEVVYLESNDTDLLAFTITLDEPLDINLGGTETIFFNVRPDNRTNTILTECTLIVTLKSVPYYRFEFESVEPSSNDENFLEGNPLEVHMKGNYTGNVNATLVAKLFLGTDEIDSETFEVSKSSKIDLVLEWNDPPSGEHDLKVKVYEKNTEEPGPLLKEKLITITVEEKYEIPLYIWIGAGIVIIIIFFGITVFLRQKGKVQVNGNSNGREEPEMGPIVAMPVEEPIVKETPRRTSKKGIKKKGRKKGKKKGKKRSGGKKKSQTTDVQQPKVRQDIGKSLTQPMPVSSPDPRPIGEPPAQQLHEYSQKSERKS